ncbi:MAG: hypothetical protein ACJAT3_002492 [Akkermansiaceae bacterium]|jgi:hypothetical protein
MGGRFCRTPDQIDVPLMPHILRDFLFISFVLFILAVIISVNHGVE